MAVAEFFPEDDVFLPQDPEEDEAAAVSYAQALAARKAQPRDFVLCYPVYEGGPWVKTRPFPREQLIERRRRLRMRIGWGAPVEEMPADLANWVTEEP